MKASTLFLVAMIYVVFMLVSHSLGFIAFARFWALLAAAAGISFIYISARDYENEEEAQDFLRELKKRKDNTLPHGTCTNGGPLGFKVKNEGDGNS